MFKLIRQSIVEAIEKLLAWLPPGQRTTQTDKIQSFSLAEDISTANHLEVQRLLTGQSADSGFYLLADNLHAFTARSDLIRRAEKTLDLQYYYFHGDTSGHLLAQLLVMAANRGVRVRILLDDIDTLGADEAIRVLNAHPEIEIRIFNPFRFRGLLRYLEFITDLVRVGRRMHNKALISDNAMAIIGGRNIGDIYFAADPQNLFLDIDLLSIGTVVRQISSSFDEYWNSPWAIPVDSLYIKPERKYALNRIKKYLNRFVQTVEIADFVKAISSADYQKELFSLPYYWANAKLYYDLPAKVDAQQQYSSILLEQLREHVNQATTELVFVSAYFVPGEQGVKWLAELVSRGVKVNVVTNSLAATDVVIAHAGYSRSRRQLLQAGVNLYELKPSAYAREKVKFKMLRAGGRTSLHAKTIIIDRQKVFIGSANLDPRSRDLNTEMGLLVENEALANEVASIFDEVTELRNSYRLNLKSVKGKSRVLWQSEVDGKNIEQQYEPDVSLGRWFKFSIYRLLPMDNLL